MRHDGRMATQRRAAETSSWVTLMGISFIVGAMLGASLALMVIK